MRDTPSRLFGLALVLIAVWIVTFWLYEPAEPPVTFGDAPAELASEPIAEPPRVRDPLQSPGEPVGPVAPPEPRAEDGAQPPPTPRGDGTVIIPPTFREYVVQEGDRGFEDIAQRVYGDRRLWQAVSRANPLVTPDRLIPGVTKLLIANDPKNIQGKVEPAPPKPDTNVPSINPPPKPVAPPEPEIEYTVQSGDTMWEIAKRFYGKGAMWKIIADANTNVLPDPSRPKVGTKLRIPPKPAD